MQTGRKILKGLKSGFMCNLHNSYLLMCLIQWTRWFGNMQSGLVRLVKFCGFLFWLRWDLERRSLLWVVWKAAALVWWKEDWLFCCFWFLILSLCMLQVWLRRPLEHTKHASLPKQSDFSLPFCNSPNPLKSLTEDTQMYHPNWSSFNLFLNSPKHYCIENWSCLQLTWMPILITGFPCSLKLVGQQPVASIRLCWPKPNLPSPNLISKLTVHNTSPLSCK